MASLAQLCQHVAAIKVIDGEFTEDIWWVFFFSFSKAEIFYNCDLSLTVDFIYSECQKAWFLKDLAI